MEAFYRLLKKKPKRSIHSGNLYGSISKANYIHLKDSYENIEAFLEYANYRIHYSIVWIVCGDLKVIRMLLGQQTGYTKITLLHL